MKKTLITVLAAFVIGGFALAENYTKGLDIAIGIPIGSLKISKEGTYRGDPATYYEKLFNIGGSLKFSTYDCFAANNTIGIFASAGADFGLGKIGGGKKYNGKNDFEWLDEKYFGIVGEFMLGPAFGCDIGNIRFQIGLAFHAFIAHGWHKESYDLYDLSGGYLSGTLNATSSAKSNAFGFALTPQFRFGANKKVSFIVGCDLTFDFAKKYKAGITKLSGDYSDIVEQYIDKGYEEYEFDKGFRFGAVPYIGLGINF